jgi:hypothetical protein
MLYLIFPSVTGKGKVVSVNVSLNSKFGKSPSMTGHLVN